MKKLLLLLISFALFSCATTKKIENSNIKLSYLDDVVIPQNLEIEGTKVGGLSGIDYHNGVYYLVCDQPSNPRIYKAEIPFINRSLDTVLITEVIKLDKTDEFYKEHTPDLEGIRFDAESNQLVISAEGSIQNGKNPSVFNISTDGEFISAYEIPEYFKASGEQKPRHNGVFEGLAESFDKSAYWVAMELPLEKDGPKPKIYPTNSPVRITKFNKDSQTAERQFSYKLDGITKLPINWFAVNGVTEILEYAEDKFLVLERAFSAGYGSNGNTVKIFDVDASKATNTLEMENLRKSDYQNAEKRLVFDFKSVKNFLTEETIDNIEGMTFGPDLPNGKKSLILVSDDNFSSFSDQITQFILLELEIK
ncbi:esterase-like activity of phytase family protein [Salegentibacter sp. JZCK2]|uniref:esterase-like activity of phytase family protein n=1 Tax=Salegentibacter tibetensis TaxID=2873600 RepID=UPI001CCC5741|nr:esterase-like activity of phytase family protein [Salegentibacter tibetensis]MBZ9729445.1 esterase-like activity of phytase family protein [Salegentibacter tibetensis]